MGLLARFSELLVGTKTTTQVRHVDPDRLHVGLDSTVQCEPNQIVRREVVQMLQSSTIPNNGLADLG
jgi:hypothetical protein